MIDHDTTTQAIEELVKDLRNCPSSHPHLTPVGPDGVTWYSDSYVDFDTSGMQLIWEVMPLGGLKNYGPYRDHQTKLALFAKNMCEKNEVKFFRINTVVETSRNSSGRNSKTDANMILDP